MSQGFFISFEGGEGAGKTTQIALLKQAFEEKMLPVTATREPGGSENAEAIRSLLVSGTAERWDATTEILLNYAARSCHLKETIRPALEAGHHVLCDRFIDSTTAYQGYAGGGDMGLIGCLEKQIVGQTRPDLTLIFDFDPANGLERTRARATHNEDRFENKSADYHKRLREGFLQIARAEPERCVVIDATGSVEQVAMRVRQAVSARLGLL